MRSHSSRRKGFVLVAFALALLLILGAVGLSFDIGRMYITKNESQSFCDAAAIAATLKLDGTVDGIANAKSAALATVKGWQFGTSSFKTDPVNIQITFGTSLANPFVETPADPTGYTYARVTVTNVRLWMGLMPVLTNTFNANIGASATAKQLHLTGVPQGVFPFSPYRHPSNYTPDAPTATGCGWALYGATPCNIGLGGAGDPGFVISALGTYDTRSDDIGADVALLDGNPVSGYAASGAKIGPAPLPLDKFGIIPAVYKDSSGNTHYRHGGIYTLQWASKPANDPLGSPPVEPSKSSDLKNGVLCPGEYNALSAAIGQAVSNAHGYIWSKDSAPTIADGILNSSTGGHTVTVDETVGLTSGAKESDIKHALNQRVQMDPDPTSQWYIDYFRKRRDPASKLVPGVNEYRVVTVPVNTGDCSVPGNSPCNTSNQVVEFAKFFLLPSYEGTGNTAACAEYIGRATVEGGGSGAAGPGVYVVRLVQ